MALESLEVFGLIVGCMVLPHPPKHFETTLAQATQRTGVLVTRGAFGLVVGLGTAASLAAFIDPQVHRVTQDGRAIQGS